MNRISSVDEMRRELQQASLDLDSFIRLVNDLLPRYVPAGSAEKAVVSVRLARYFQTQGLLDEPFKEGREARYGARHVLQLLAIRRLMANGYSTGSLSDLLRGASDDVLQRVIEGETPRVEAAPTSPSAAAPANAALEFLNQVRRRGSPGVAPAMPSASAPAPVPSPTPSLPLVTETSWTRSEIARGIEVHVRDDFQEPQSPHEWDVLVEAFKNAVRSPPVKKRRR